VVVKYLDFANQGILMPVHFDTNLLRDTFAERFDTNVSLARFTSARIGGPADGMLTSHSIDDLVEMVTFLWEGNIPFQIIGGGSNILVSDAGVRGVVLLNKARRVKFDLEGEPLSVWAESGANLGRISRQAATHGLSGLEWAVGIPGSIGGAVVGNAGAHGGDIAGNLLMAEILHQEKVDKKSKNGNSPTMLIHREKWPVERFEYDYRSSRIKTNKYGTGQLRGMDLAGWMANKQPDTIILAALFRLERSTRREVTARINDLVAHRQQTQPPGASMGSMFKNPTGDYAGRLIEAAGLKGTRIGDAAISSLHANFFVNYGQATARDVWELISLARGVVEKKFGITLDLEIELIGSWEGNLS
jgi:UDP-N-acetylmuramate dehydrogenase